MGSWYETCGLSHTPIREDDNIVCFILRVNREKMSGSFIYSNDLYEPISIPIFGKYGGYGEVIDIEENDELHPLIIEKILNSSELKAQNMSELLKHIERDRIENLGLVMFHREIYDEIVKEMGDRYEYSLEYNVRSYYLKSIDEYINRVKVIEKEGIIAFFDEERDMNIFNRKMQRKVSFYKKIVVEKLNLKNIIVDFMIFKDAMEMSRNLWVPQAGSGSQDLEYELPKIIGEFTIKKQKEEELEE